MNMKRICNRRWNDNIKVHIEELVWYDDGGAIVW